MSIKELKESIHQKIEAINDEEFLLAVDNILKQERTYIIPEDWKSDIQEAKEEYKNGQYLSEEEFKKKMTQWE